MTRNEKKTAIENMAERFMNISDLEGKSMAIMVMSAYAEGKAADIHFGSISRHRITTLHKSRLRVRQIVHPVSLQS